MTPTKLPKKFSKLLDSVTNKRPKIVIDHIRKHGQITNEELNDIYGYAHPPRAIRDVRECGIPLVTFTVSNTSGKKITAYKFGNFSEVRATQLSGRTRFSSMLKNTLIEKHGARCNIYLSEVPVQQLQVDHRIPFEIAGDNLSDDANEYMLLCASANRTKSWNCENCQNWEDKDVNTCQTCYWAHPESYKHIAMCDIRRLDLLWLGEEIASYNKLIKEANKVKQDAPEYVKNILHKHLQKRK